TTRSWSRSARRAIRSARSCSGPRRSSRGTEPPLRPRGAALLMAPTDDGRAVVVWTPYIVPTRPLTMNPVSGLVGTMYGVQTTTARPSSVGAMSKAAPRGRRGGSVPREERLGPLQLRALRIALLAERDQLRVVTSRLVAIAGEFGRPSHAVKAVEAVGRTAQCRLEFHQGLRWLLKIKEQFAQQFARRHDWPGRHRVLLRRVLKVSG